MKIGKLSQFKSILLIDYEFFGQPGDRPTPVCLAVRDFRTGTVKRYWQDEFANLSAPPYPIDDQTLIVGYYLGAELSCHLALNWKLPVHLLDLYVEFRCITNGLQLPAGSGLLGALLYFGLDALSAATKEEMRQLILMGGPWNFEDRQRILDYCQTDVDALSLLLPAILEETSLRHALLRGRYIHAVAHIEHFGSPIDVPLFEQLRKRWPDIQGELIEEIDKKYRVFEGRTFKVSLFEKYLLDRQYAWPRHDTGSLKLDEDTFKDMTKRYPELHELHQLKSSLGKLRKNSLAVGRDGRNRTLLSPFSSRTSRNQPGTSEFVFGLSSWMRGLLKPAPGNAIAYIDWSQQEFGIAAALSKDQNMMDAYESGDPYLAFAKQAGAAPPDATKKSHASIRDQFKACVLAVQYGMGEHALALKVGTPPIFARGLLELHRKTYVQFWKWSDSVVDYAILSGSLHTVFGWQLRVSEDPNPRFLRNFPMQANGAEVLRLACCLAVERGIKVCAPVHDALLIEGPANEIEETVKRTQLIMEEASEIVLNGFRLRSDATIIRHPERYCDERGIVMWETVCRLIGADTSAAGQLEDLNLSVGETLPECSSSPVQSIY